MRHITEWAIVLAAGLVVLAVTLGPLVAVTAVSCSSRWDGSGLATSWGPLQGCKVKLPDGRWMPEDRVREIEVKPEAPVG